MGKKPLKFYYFSQGSRIYVLHWSRMAQWANRSPLRLYSIQDQIKSAALALTVYCTGINPWVDIRWCMWLCLSFLAAMKTLLKANRINRFHPYWEHLQTFQSSTWIPHPSVAVPSKRHFSRTYDFQSGQAILKWLTFDLQDVVGVELILFSDRLVNTDQGLSPSS